MTTSTRSRKTSGVNRWVALIRAIGGSTHATMSMTRLRESCVAAGLSDVRTLLATGNLLFTSSESKVRVQTTLDDIVAQFGLKNEVILRTPREMSAIVAANPFAEAAATRPNHLLVLFADKPVTEKVFAAFDDWPGPERIACGTCELYLDYGEEVARSRLTPSLLDRRTGQPGTARNWNTVNKLIDACART